MEDEIYCLFYCSKFSIIKDNFYNKIQLISPGWGRTPYNGLYGEAPPERGTLFTLQVYERVGLARVKVYERVGKSVI